MKRTKFLVGLTAAMMSMPVVAFAASEPLNTGLASGYAALAQGEYDEFDYVDGDLFRDKGKKAEIGGNVQPENPDDWMIPAEAQADIKEAYAWLLMAYTKGGDIETPGFLAEAQVAYDCWVQEAEENLQPEEIAACRAKYEAARDQVRFPEPKPEARAPIVFDIFFDHDSTQLNAQALDDIRAAAAAAREEAPIDLRIAGHADRSGASDYNDKLARKRADIVAAAMMAEGIGEDLIVLSSFGEDQPRVATADGVRERLNRRAEVRLVFGGEAPAAMANDMSDGMGDGMGDMDSAPAAAVEAEDDFFDTGDEDDMFASEEAVAEEAPAEEMMEEAASEEMESEMDAMEDEMTEEAEEAAEEAASESSEMEAEAEAIEEDMDALESEMDAEPEAAPAEDEFMFEEDDSSEEGLEFLGEEDGTSSEDGMDFLSGEAEENPEDGLDFLQG